MMGDVKNCLHCGYAKSSVNHYTECSLRCDYCHEPLRACKCGPWNGGVPVWRHP